ncbi:replicative DNA helicase [Prevotella sp. tf2-5]|uniref:replicative DNA helicase n=1 Tax=Prevotella sp. tf2-5 TaxID=1761889 RepID=UPI0008E0FEB4|nr:replicative DNA helicase [Prevotella sp. tf2-5]SFO74455.1 primary replicative DNA helicase [Prevotella sp. tf2-5]
MTDQKNQYTRKQGRSGQQPLDFSLAHVMPQAPDMEKAVLGALMIDKDAYLEVCDLLRPESFYEPRNQMVYEAIQQLSMEESPVDVLTVVDKLEKTGRLLEIGGPGYIAELSSMVVTSANIEYHARVVAEKYLSRQMAHYVSVIGKKTFDETYDIKDVIQEADSQLLEISQKSVKKDYSVLGPIVNQAVKIVEAAYANKGGLTGISTGFYKLDDMTCGWQKSDLVIIAGRPAMGKTAFALSLAKNIAVDQKIPMAFFSLEMTSVQLANRLMANNCQIEGHKLMSGQLKRDDWERLDKHLNSLLEAPLYVDDTEGISVMELRTKIRRLIKEHHIELVMVDYLQLMTASGMRYNNRQEEISLISRALKGMAKEFNIPVIALSQLNRGVDTREGPEGKRPRLSDLRESGAIEQDADMVIFLHRPEYYGLYQSEDGSIDYRGKAEVIISKHRKGAVGIVMMDFKGEYTRFENEEDNRIGNRPPTDGGEIIGSSMNNMPFPPPETPFPNA